jgi:hypothetical protein
LNNTIFNSKRIFYRIGLYGVAGVIAFSLYARANVPLETDQEYCDRTGRVKIHDRFFKYDVYQNGEMKPIVDMLTHECNGDKDCEINHAYHYVANIPYKESSVSRTPSDVINQNGGDCDEKSFLLATLLLEKRYKCLLITTKDHAFIAVQMEKEQLSKLPISYLLIQNQRYYIADTTMVHGYIGADNNVSKQEIDGIYDMVEKKEISLDKVEFQLIKS